MGRLPRQMGASCAGELSTKLGACRSPPWRKSKTGVDNKCSYVYYMAGGSISYPQNVSFRKELQKRRKLRGVCLHCGSATPRATRALREPDERATKTASPGGPKSVARVAPPRNSGVARDCPLAVWVRACEPQNATQSRDRWSRRVALPARPPVAALFRLGGRGSCRATELNIEYRTRNFEC